MYEYQDRQTGILRYQNVLTSLLLFSPPLGRIIVPDAYSCLFFDIILSVYFSTHHSPLSLSISRESFTPVTLSDSFLAITMVWRTLWITVSTCFLLGECHLSPMEIGLPADNDQGPHSLIGSLITMSYGPVQPRQKHWIEPSPITPSWHPHRTGWGGHMSYWGSPQS